MQWEIVAGTWETGKEKVSILCRTGTNKFHLIQTCNIERYFQFYSSICLLILYYLNIPRCGTSCHILHTPNAVLCEGIWRHLRYTFTV
jgi:hypothetical protein